MSHSTGSVTPGHSVMDLNEVSVSPNHSLMDLDDESPDLSVLSVQPVQDDQFSHLDVIRKLRDRDMLLSDIPELFAAERKKAHRVVGELNGLLPLYPTREAGCRERPPRAELETIFNLLLKYENSMAAYYTHMISVIEENIESDKLAFGFVVEWAEHIKQYQ